MSMELYLAAVVLLMSCAVLDVIVGVSNDAVNFLNSSFGSGVATRRTITLIASVGILMGVMFSSGMMEVARKGIFHPRFFTMPELLTIFVAVMLTDVLLLDLFNTYGLPTSTTVSIVFELLGAAVAVSVLKILEQGELITALATYINTGKAMIIIFGILLSVVIAFFFGALVQFFSRLLFTFDYEKTLRRFGAIWGGAAMATIVFFILVKGAKGTAFVAPDTLDWIQTNTWTLLLAIFGVTAGVFQILISAFRINVFKPVVLVGTFALAMAFAANDLVNFIGVPLAGLAAYRTALGAADPLEVSMAALSGEVRSQTPLLLIAGALMVGTLWLSRKARSVTETEINLGKQDEGVERFESMFLSRLIVRMVGSFIDLIRALIPAPVRSWAARRTDPAHFRRADAGGSRPSFDLVRASVNLVVASAVISYATSMKLPLSTTYVTFMVAMGTSFSDRAWDSESAVYRVTGVLTVVGGWFMTALIAFSVAFVFANIIHYFHLFGMIGLVVFAVVVIRATGREHRDRVKEAEEVGIFNLSDPADAPTAICQTFEHTGRLLREIRESLDCTFEAFLDRDISELRRQRKKVRQVQRWINIIIANIFKTLRLIQREEAGVSFRYAQTVRRLQKLSDGYRDIVARAQDHVGNNHQGFLDEQVADLRRVRGCLDEILSTMERVLKQNGTVGYAEVAAQDERLNQLARELDESQVQRIQDNTSRTRLSILYYALIGNCKVISRQNLKLLRIFQDSFPLGPGACPAEEKEIGTSSGDSGDRCRAN